MTHTHPGDGTVPGLHGEPIPTPVLGCPACATVHSIGGELDEPTSWKPGDTLTFSTDDRVGLPEGVHETVLIDGDRTIPVTVTVHPDGTHEIRGRVGR